MSQQELLGTIIDILEASGIEYMLTGSVVSSMQGEPRATHDIDVIAVIPITSGEKLFAALSASDLHHDQVAIMNALRAKTMFNLIDSRGGGKVDFWILPDEPFERSRFDRRRKQQIFGREAYVSSPEDTIIAKLRWAKMSGGSEKHFTDALRVYEVQYEGLDADYIHLFVKELKLDDVWRRLIAEAEPLS